jgi:hypothetical protein
LVAFGAALGAVLLAAGLRAAGALMATLAGALALAATFAGAFAGALATVFAAAFGAALAGARTRVIGAFFFEIVLAIVVSPMKNPNQFGLSRACLDLRFLLTAKCFGMASIESIQTVCCAKTSFFVCFQLDQHCSRLWL